MARHRVEHDAGLVEALEEVGADGGVAAFDVVVDGLADVVEQAGPAGDGAVQAQFVRHHLGQEGHLDAVSQDVLAVAGSEAQGAQEAQHLVGQAADVRLDGRILAKLEDLVVDLVLASGPPIPRCARGGFGRPGSAAPWTGGRPPGGRG